jgi:hypothetical protein
MGNRKHSQRRSNLRHKPAHYTVLVAFFCTSRFLTIALSPPKVNLADAPSERLGIALAALQAQASQREMPVEAATIALPRQEKGNSLWDNHTRWGNGNR